MVSKIVKIKNPTGLNLHPAGKLCETAVKFRSEISFEKGESRTNVKSLLSVLGAGVRYGDEIQFICNGEDETEALEAVVAAVEGGLGE